MNSTPKLEFHPGAENLNAFAEQALPEQERGQILAHLAVCSRCRQVIFLAQEAASGLETNAAAAEPPAHSASRVASWLRGWRLAWIPAAALSAVVALAILVHLRHTEPGPELATAAPQSVPRDDGRISRPSVNERLNPETAQSPVAPVAKKLAQGNAHSAPLRAVSNTLPAEAVPPAAPVKGTDEITGATSERESPALPSGAPGQGIATAQFKPEPPAAPQPQPVVGTLSSTATSPRAAARATQAGINGMANRAQTGQTESVTVEAQQVQVLSAQDRSFARNAQLPEAEIQAAPRARAFMLPSGLTSRSTVKARNRMLAVDQAGTLFLSEDSGRHWESVARRWVGRVVVVRLQQALNGNAAGTAGEGAKQGGGLSAGAAMAPLPPAAVFEIVNDSDQIWSSTDGKTWKAQ